MTIEERFERLEKSLRQRRRATIALVGLIAVIVIAGAVDSTPAELTVRRLTVVDENGKACITLLRKSAIDFTGIVMEQPTTRDNESTGGSVLIVASKDGASMRLGFGTQDDNRSAASLVVNRKEPGRLFFTDAKKEIQNP